MVYVVVGCQFLIGVVFLVSAASKLRSRSNLRTFAASLRQLHLLPSQTVGPIALAVAYGEAAIAVLLLAPTVLGATAPRPGVVGAGFTGALVLLSTFSAVILTSIRRGIRAPCRCFGAANSPLGGRHVLRNGVLAAAAGIGLAAAVAGDAPAPSLAGVLVAAAGGVALAVLTVVSDELAELLAPSTRTPGAARLRRTG